MRRKRTAECWNHFTDVDDPGVYKTARVACNYCGATFAASCRTMRIHMGGSSEMPRFIGRVPLVASCQSTVETTQQCIGEQLKQRDTPRFSEMERSALDQAFADAVHLTATPFSQFKHSAWREFFAMLSPQWSPPTPERISTNFLSDHYEKVMRSMRHELAAAPAVTIGIDGATNVHAKLMTNVIAFDPRAWFVEYLKTGLARGTAAALTRSIADVASRLNDFVGKEVVSSYISDSCNTMREVRRTLIDTKAVEFAYGCAVHALNNICEDIAKTCEIKGIIRRAVFVVSIIKNDTLLRRVFESLCKEKHGKKYALLLYSASRWSSVNYMFTRLSKVKAAVQALNAAVTTEKSQRGIDESFFVSSALATLSCDPQFWLDVARAVDVFDPICKSIGILESNSATLATAYAAFLHVRVHIEHVFAQEAREVLVGKLYSRWDRIWSPTHALAFVCDPLYQAMRKEVIERLGQEALGLGHGDLNEQCRVTLEVLCRRDGSLKATLEDFLQFCYDEDRFATSTWRTMSESHPRKVWTQGKAQYPVLAAQLFKLYCAPASTAGVERNHKVMKRVNCKARCAMLESTVEKEVATIFNSRIDTLHTTTQRQPFEIQCVACPFAASNQHEEPIAATNHSSDENLVEFDPLLNDLTDEEVMQQESLRSAMVRDVVC